MARKIRKHREAGEMFIPDPLDLNRWCIEMAMRWPTFEDRYLGAQGVFTQHGGVIQRTDADIIARANKILAWVKAPR